MKNLFLKFISESTNFNQERISFINSIRKNSNLRPFSLINEAAPPRPNADDLLSDMPDPGAIGLNRSPVSDFEAISRYQPSTGSTLEGYMLFDSLMRQFFGNYYDDFSPSMFNMLFNMWGGNIQSLENFLISITNGNLTITNMNGHPYSPISFLMTYFRHFEALQIISNLNPNNYAENQIILQNLFNTNQMLWQAVNNMLNALQQTGSLSNYFNFYNNAFNQFSQYGINIPNINQLNNQINNFQSIINSMWNWNGPLEMPDIGSYTELNAPIVSQGTTATTNQTMINIINSIELYMQGNLSNEAYSNLLNQLNSLDLTGWSGVNLLEDLQRLYSTNRPLYDELINALNHYDPANPQQFQILIRIMQQNMALTQANITTVGAVNDILRGFYLIFKRLF